MNEKTHQAKRKYTCQVKGGQSRSRPKGKSRPSRGRYPRAPERVYFYPEYTPRASYIEKRFQMALGMVLLPLLPLLGIGVVLLLVAEGVRAIMRRVREAKQREAKLRYLEKLREQSKERHRIKKRARVNPCPTVEAVCAQWDKSRDSLQEMVKFGLLLLDLESHVDNSLILGPVGPHGLPLIIGRQPGVKGWLSDHCPHIGYKTAMRYKSLAEKVQKSAKGKELVGKCKNLHDLQESLYKDLDIVHFELEKARLPRRMHRLADWRFGRGEPLYPSLVRDLRHHARDAMQNLSGTASRRFVDALQNLAAEMRGTT